MAVWLIRAGKYGEDENAALEKGLAIIGWKNMLSVDSVKSYEEMKQRHVEAYPEMSPKAVMNNAAQLWAFLKKINVDDIVVLPLKTQSMVAIGKIKGPYEYREDRHVRVVEWCRTNVPRTDIGQDLLFSLGAFMTVCQIKRNDAEKRFKSMLNGQKDPNLTSKLETGEASPSIEDISESEETLIDLEEQAYDQIRVLLETKFKGHNLSRLAEAILNAQGYQTFRSPEGPDGGVDILAGYGAMGFDSPRICVQVKSGGIQNDAAIRELEGAMSRLGANQGLFISWDGFNKSALLKVKDLFFKVRLWDDKKLIAALLDNYSKLADEIQAELPLKRIWVIVPEQE